MKGIEKDDRVEIINAWNTGAIGHVHHFTSAGDLAYVTFEKPQFSQGNWWDYDWYTRDQLAKLVQETPQETPELPPTNEQAFLNALFPARYASLNDAMRASGADGEE